MNEEERINNQEPTEEEVKAFWDEVEEHEKKWMFRCKPTFNFQSVEFEFYGGMDDMPEMFAIYKKIVDELMALAPEQPAKQVVSQPKKPAVDMPTPKMYDIMDKYGIKYTSKTTKAEAQQLIADNLKKD